MKSKFYVICWNWSYGRFVKAVTCMYIQMWLTTNESVDNNQFYIPAHQMQPHLNQLPRHLIHQITKARAYPPVMTTSVIDHFYIFIIFISIYVQYSYWIYNIIDDWLVTGKGRTGRILLNVQSQSCHSGKTQSKWKSQCIELIRSRMIRIY